MLSKQLNVGSNWQMTEQPLSVSFRSQIRILYNNGCCDSGTLLCVVWWPSAWVQLTSPKTGLPLLIGAVLVDEQRNKD